MGPGVPLSELETANNGPWSSPHVMSPCFLLSCYNSFASISPPVGLVNKPLPPPHPHTGITPPPPPTSVLCQPAGNRHTGYQTLVTKNFSNNKILKELSYEIDFENVDENWQILALTRAAAGFWIFQRHLWFLVEIKHLLAGKCKNNADSLCNPIIFVPVLPASLSYRGSVIL